MDNINIIEDKKRHNAPFLSSFRWMTERYHLTQKDLAKLIGLNSPLISEYKSGKKRVSVDTMEALVRASGGKLSLAYMQGLSGYMLLANAPDEEIIEIQKRRENPDYDIMKNISNNIDTPHTEPIPAWADSLIHLVTDNTVAVQALRDENKQLKEILADVIRDNNKLRQELSKAINELHLSLHRPAIYTEREDSIPMAAEQSNQ